MFILNASLVASGKDSDLYRNLIGDNCFHVMLVTTQTTTQHNLKMVVKLDMKMTVYTTETVAYRSLRFKFIDVH